MTQQASIFSLLEFDEDDGRTVALALTCLASDLASRELDDDRRDRKQKVVGIKCEALRSIGLVVPPLPWERVEQGKPQSLPQALQSLLGTRIKKWEEAKRTTLLVELALADAFAPYELRVAKNDRTAGLKEMARLLGLDAARANDVDDSIESARKAHRHIAWAKIGITTTLGIIAVATGGFVAAPLLGEAIGVGAGLSGAAATAHGLAILGGGSLAAGGGGMAGGIAAVTGIGAVAGGVGAGGSMALWSAGHAAAATELVKLQVAFREVLLRSQLRQMAAAQVVETLNVQVRKLRDQLDLEKGLNDKRSARIEELERVVQAYEDACNWVRANGGSEASA